MRSRIIWTMPASGGELIGVGMMQCRLTHCHRRSQLQMHVKGCDMESLRQSVGSLRLIRDWKEKYSGNKTN